MNQIMEVLLKGGLLSEKAIDVLVLRGLLSLEEAGQAGSGPVDPAELAKEIEAALREDDGEAVLELNGAFWVDVHIDAETYSGVFQPVEGTLFIKMPEEAHKWTTRERYRWLFRHCSGVYSFSFRGQRVDRLSIDEEIILYKGHPWIRVPRT